MSNTQGNTRTELMLPFETRQMGDPENPLLFFVHGWPDDASLWRKQFDALSDDFHCIAVTLPNLGAEPVKAGGFDIPELVEGLAATIRATRVRDEPVLLVTHDWGAYLGYMLEQGRPELIARMVAMDVGGHAKPDDFKTVVFVTGYQWMLILFWLIGGIIPPLGNVLSRWFGRLIRVPRRQSAGLKSRFNYIYFYFWRSLFFSRWKGGFLYRYRPSCPVLYLYGKRKPVMFHSQRWLQIITESGGRTDGIAGAGHWFMETHPEVVNQAIRDWCLPAS